MRRGHHAGRRLLCSLGICATLGASPGARGEVSTAEVVAPERTLEPGRGEDRGVRDLLELLQASEASGADARGQPLLDGVALPRWLLRWDGIPLLRARDPADDLRSLALPLGLTPALALRRGPQAGAPDALAGVIDLAPDRGVAPFGGRLSTEARGGDAAAGRASLQLATRSRSWRTLLVAAAEGGSARPGAASVLGRGEIALGQRGRAGLQVLQTSWRDGDHGIDRQLFSLHSNMQLAPGHLLRFRWSRQHLLEQEPAPGAGIWRSGETGVDVGYAGELVERHALVAHLGGRVADRRAARPAHPVAHIQRAVFGAWLQDTWRIRDNLGVVGVAGIDLDDAVGPLPAGHAVLRYEPAPALVLRGRIGTASRGPGLDERSARGPRSFLWPDIAPGALRPERAQGLDVSLGLEPSTAAGLHGGLFSLELSDLLVPTRDGVAPVRNGGREELQGLFVDARAANLPGGLGLWLGYQWLWGAVDAWRERGLPERMAHQLRLHATWDLGSLGSHLFAGVDLGLPAIATQPGRSTASAELGLRQRLFERLELVLAAAQRGPVQGVEAGPLQRELRLGLALR